MRGIDISNHQGGIDLGAILPNVDFVICKATGGNFFVDPWCDTWVQQCRNTGKPWGFYHFANDGAYSDPVTEADFFIANTLNYFGEGIPVLDWEVDVSVDWVNQFVEHVHYATGVWCWVYANPWRINAGGVNPNCGRWIADYIPVERPGLSYPLGDVPNTDGLVCAWQFASDGVVGGYGGNLDVNEFYGDAQAWALYAGSAAGGDGGGDTPEDLPAPNEPHILVDGKYKITVEEL